MGFFDSNQSWMQFDNSMQGVEGNYTPSTEQGLMGTLGWNDPSNTQTRLYGSGAQGYSENLRNLLGAWAQANGQSLDQFYGAPGADTPSEAVGLDGRVWNDAAAAEFVRQNFGDVALGVTQTGGSSNTGEQFRQDLLQRAPDGSWRPINGATWGASNTGTRSDGTRIASTLLPFVGGWAANAYGVGANAGAAAGEGAVGVTGSNGAFLGEGVASGVPAWDSAYTAAGGGFGATGVGSNEGVLDWSAERPVTDGSGAPDAIGYGTAGNAGYTNPTTGAGYGGAASTSASGIDWTKLGSQGLNALYQSYQSNKAEDALTAAGNQANATQRYIFDTLRADQAPYRQSGYNALSRIEGLMRDPNSVTSDPGYQFGLKEGLRSIDNSASARGGIGGAALRAGARFGNDYATTKLNDVFNRNATIAGFGQVANNQGIATGQNYGNNVSQNQLWMGNQQAGNYLNQGNIYGNALDWYGANYGRRGG